jgi:ribonuclease HII
MCLIVTGQSHTVLAACDVTLIASGTATLEAALFKRPMVIAYNMNWLSWQIMRRKQLQPWVGLPNILCQAISSCPNCCRTQPHRRPWQMLSGMAGRSPAKIIACNNASGLHPNCSATPPHWPPMRSRKFLKAEQAALVWDTPGLVAGVDEAGRGPLAGPVVAAAVILDDLNPIKGLADSKTLTALRREKLYDEIRAKALCCSIAEARWKRSIGSTSCRPPCWLCSARWRAAPEARQGAGGWQPAAACWMCWPKPSSRATARCRRISAASILAKVHRDRWCEALHQQLPDYGFDGHKGYGTARTWRRLRAARRLPATPQVVCARRKVLA